MHTLVELLDLVEETKDKRKRKGREQGREGVDRDIEKYYMTIVVTWYNNPLGFSDLLT